jgi:hypothetical protein
MKMSQIETLNSKELNKGIFFFSEYYFINNETNQNNLLKKADYLRKKFNIQKFVILGYFDNEEVLKFLGNDFCKSYENHVNKVKSNFFDIEDENIVDAFNFEFALIDYVSLNNAHKYLGNSNFTLAIDKNNKIVFSTKRYYMKNLVRFAFFGLGLSLCLLYIFIPNIENLILIE